MRANTNCKTCFGLGITMKGPIEPCGDCSHCVSSAGSLSGDNQKLANLLIEACRRLPEEDPLRQMAVAHLEIKGHLNPLRENTPIIGTAQNEKP